MSPNLLSLVHTLQTTDTPYSVQVYVIITLGEYKNDAKHNFCVGWHVQEVKFSRC